MAQTDARRFQDSPAFVRIFGNSVKLVGPRSPSARMVPARPILASGRVQVLPAAGIITSRDPTGLALQVLCAKEALHFTLTGCADG